MSNARWAKPTKSAGNIGPPASRSHYARRQNCIARSYAAPLDNCQVSARVQRLVKYPPPTDLLSLAAVLSAVIVECKPGSLICRRRLFARCFGVVKGTMIAVAGVGAQNSGQ